MKKSITPIATRLTVPRPTRTDTPAAKRRATTSPPPIPREEESHQCVASDCSQFGTWHEHDSIGSSPIVEVLNPSMAPPTELMAECPTLRMPSDWQKQFDHAEA